jgi:hypothetical protein
MHFHDRPAEIIEAVDDHRSPVRSEAHSVDNGVGSDAIFEIGFDAFHRGALWPGHARIFAGGFDYLFGLGS